MSLENKYLGEKYQKEIRATNLIEFNLSLKKQKTRSETTLYEIACHFLKIDRLSINFVLYCARISYLKILSNF